MNTKEQILTEKVETLIENEQFSVIKDFERKQTTKSILENQIKFLQGLSESADPSTTTQGVSNWDPVIVKMVRRGVPMLMAFDVTGVQPMSGPSCSVFAMRSRYTSQTGTEALFNEADSGFSGDGTQGGDTSGFAADAFGAGDPVADTTYGTGMDLATAEAKGTTSGTPWRELTMSIERTNVSATSRKLKSTFTRELQYDLKKIHNLDAETVLANNLTTEIVAEIDRQLLRTINVSAVLGSQNSAVAGVYDLSADSDGRWLVEKFKGLVFQLELEANAINRTTRRGKANRIICSSDVASALNMAGLLDYNPAMAAQLNVDETNSTFAGIILGRYQVHIDPYALRNYATLVYKGANSWDAGIYYCPYVPLEMVRATGEDSFQPKIGFQTRYGIVANPFASTLENGTSKAGLGLGQGENPYFRKFAIANLTG